MTDEILLSEKYRPKKLEDCILPKSIKDIASSIIESDNIPNLLLTGTAGLGKTTLAKVLLKTMDYEYLFINASNEGRSLDTLRTTITDFASGVSLTGRKKVVILDEFDGTTDIVQEALRGFFENYSSSCAFILTANNKNKIKTPIISRFSNIDFKIPKEEMGVLAVQFAKRLIDICDIEGIKYDKRAISELVKLNFPDFRQTLNKLQLSLMTKVLDMDSVKSTQTPIQTIVDNLKQKNFKELRKIVANIPNIDIPTINKELYNIIDDSVTPQTIPMMILIMSDYNYKSNFSTDMEVCLMAEFVEILSQVDFK